MRVSLVKPAASLARGCSVEPSRLAFGTLSLVLGGLGMWGGTWESLAGPVPWEQGPMGASSPGPWATCWHSVGWELPYHRVVLLASNGHV